MIMAVASGKGGTGKTTVALALAAMAGPETRLLDCDVEEPNCHLFLPSEVKCQATVHVPVPVVDPARCNGCGQCAQFCAYHALAALPRQLLIFPELCHSCGGCFQVCPTQALHEEPEAIGTIEIRRHQNLELISGRLTVGKTMSPPLIRAVKKYIDDRNTTVIDCPPGTACPVVTAVRGADYVVLVTEPTPFGLHDLTLAVDVMRELGLACGVILNRADAGDRSVHDYCRRENLPLLLEIPQRRAIAEAYSRGQPLLEAMPELQTEFRQLLERLKTETATGAIIP